MISRIEAALRVADAIKQQLSPYTVLESSQEREPNTGFPLHAFDLRNIHSKLPKRMRALFDDGHFSEATFEATKYLEKCVKHMSGTKDKSGYPLMMAVFNEQSPKIAFSKLSNQSEIDEQAGLKFMFAGVSSGIRNPRGHESEFVETVDECLDHLAIVSFLLRRLESAGHPFP